MCAQPKRQLTFHTRHFDASSSSMHGSPENISTNSLPRRDIVGYFVGNIPYHTISKLGYPRSGQQQPQGSLIYQPEQTPGPKPP